MTELNYSFNNIFRDFYSHKALMSKHDWPHIIIFVAPTTADLWTTLSMIEYALFFVICLFSCDWNFYWNVEQSQVGNVWSWEGREGGFNKVKREGECEWEAGLWKKCVTVCVCVWKRVKAAVGGACTCLSVERQELESVKPCEWELMCVLKQHFTQKWQICYHLPTVMLFIQSFLEHKTPFYIALHIMGVNRDWRCLAPKWQKATWKYNILHSVFSHMTALCRECKYMYHLFHQSPEMEYKRLILSMIVKFIWK